MKKIIEIFKNNLEKNDYEVLKNIYNVDLGYEKDLNIGNISMLLLSDLALKKLDTEQKAAITHLHNCLYIFIELEITLANFEEILKVCSYLEDKKKQILINFLKTNNKILTKEQIIKLETKSKTSKKQAYDIYLAKNERLNKKL